MTADEWRKIEDKALNDKCATWYGKRHHVIVYPVKKYELYINGAKVCTANYLSEIHDRVMPLPSEGRQPRLHIALSK